MQVSQGLALWWVGGGGLRARTWLNVGGTRCEIRYDGELDEIGKLSTGELI